MKRFSCGTILLLGLLLLIGGSATRVAQPQDAQLQAGSLQVCPQGCPYQQIQAAVDAAHPGDEITIAPGIYQENLLLTKPLTISGTGSANQVVVTAKEAGKPTVRVFNPDRQPGSLPLQVKLQSLTITGARRPASPVPPGVPLDPCSGGLTRPCTGLFIESSPVTLTTSGGQMVSYWNAVHLMLVDVQVVRNAFAGIEWQGQVDLVLLRSRINENGDAGIHPLGYGSAQVALYDSEVSYNKSSGAHLLETKAEDVQFRAVDSRFVGNEGTGILVFSGCGVYDVPRMTIVMEGVTVRQNQGGGVTLVQSAATLRISDSFIEENEDVGVFAYGCSIGIPRVSISRTRIAKNRAAGITISSDGVLQLSESVIAENGRQPRFFNEHLGGGPGIDLEFEGVRGFLDSNEIRGNAGYGIMVWHPENISLCLHNKVSENGLGNYNSQAVALKCR